MQDVIRDFIFADDCALNSGSEQLMQSNMDRFSNACDNIGLTISTKKTEDTHQLAASKQYMEPTITVKGLELEVVDKFTYLGSTFSRVVHIDDEIHCCIVKASIAFGRMQTSLWK